MTSDGTLYVELTWPSSELSPNRARNLHWSVISKAKRLYRESCYSNTVPCKGAELPEDQPLEARFVFCPPDRRSYDLDNLHGRMKAGIDGIADAMGFNDKRIRRAVCEFGDIEEGGKVYVTISPLGL